MLNFEKSIGQFQAGHNQTLYTIRAIVNGIELQYMHYPTGDTGTFVFATVAEAIAQAEMIASKLQSNEAGQ